MFRHKSKYLIASGFILMLILMIALAGVGLTRMAAIHHHLDVITEKYNTKTDIIFSMRHIVRERALSTYAMFIMDNPFQREEEYHRFTNMAGEFIQLRDLLIQLGLSEKERNALNEVLERVREYQPLHMRLVDRITHEQTDGIREEILNHDLLRQREMLDRLDRMVDMEREESRAAAMQASSEYRSAYLAMIFLTVAAMVFGVLIAWYVIHRTRLIETALAQEKEHAEITLHSVGDAVIAADEEGKVSYLNPAAEQMTGWRSDEARGQPLRNIYSIINGVTRKPLEHPAMLGVLDTPIVGLNKHTLLVSRSGKEFAIEDTAAPIRNSESENVGAILVFRDVTEQRSMQNQLSWQASHDSLTGLANRREFEVLLERLLASTKEQDKRHALLYLDLDQFKVINDTCGHVAGDELLRQVAGLMRPLIRDSDTLARLGGDEFGILLEGCSLPQADQIAHKLLQSLEEFRFAWQDKTFRVGVSIGLVGVHARSGTISAVMSTADSACYMAKEKGRNRVWIHHDNDREAAHRQGEMEWVSRIMRAFDENRFVLYFQRVIPLTASAGSHPYREVLVRMRDEKGELVPPMAFIPAAERYGVMSMVDRWVVKSAFEWLADHPAEESLAVNLSSQSLGDDGFLDFVMEQFHMAGLSPRRICFEITETAAIANWNRATQFIAALRALGCCFALDDFGSGMSSFGYLKNLPVDFIKIDGAFVRDMIEDEIDFAMVEAVNRIGHVMGIRTTAEYVENDRILARLREIGVDYAQGFGIHMPEPLILPERRGIETSAPVDDAGPLQAIISVFRRPGPV
ncbi:MAG: EAL domain-containing protein [Gammaproteobacteria bacterium]|nr:EAL domain-containing protein [Gammaproteobacteria bacterium]